MKIITVVGSIKYQREMMDIAMKLELEGNCMLVPIVHHTRDKDNYSKEKLEMLGKMHKEKIKLSDAVLVVNVDNYIGKSTKSEIEFAKSLNKEIIYYTDIEKE